MWVHLRLANGYLCIQAVWLNYYRKKKKKKKKKTDGSAAVGTHCRYAVADILDGTLLDQLFSCYNITPNSSCPSDCKNGLLILKALIGCCYQSIYNNTLYFTELFNAGFLTARDFYCI